MAITKYKLTEIKHGKETERYFDFAYELRSYLDNDVHGLTMELENSNIVDYPDFDELDFDEIVEFYETFKLDGWEYEINEIEFVELLDGRHSDRIHVPSMRSIYHENSYILVNGRLKWLGLDKVADFIKDVEELQNKPYEFADDYRFKLDELLHYKYDI